MQQEDEWDPEMKGESILKSKVINFSNQVIDRNIQQYNSKPTPYEHHGDDSQKSQNEEQLINEKDKPKQDQNLYDPLEDQCQQTWVLKTLQKQYQRPLSCPGCFTPLCYSYTATNIQGQFITKNILNCNYNPYPISPNTSVNTLINPQTISIISNQQFCKLKECLQNEQSNIDLKFELECSNCKNTIGCYEANQDHFRLVDLI